MALCCYGEYSQPYIQGEATTRCFNNLEKEEAEDTSWCLCWIICAVAQCFLALLCLSDFPWSSESDPQNEYAVDRGYSILNPFANEHDTSRASLKLQSIIRKEAPESVRQYEISDYVRNFLGNLQDRLSHDYTSLSDVSKITVTSTKVFRGDTLTNTTLVIDAHGSSSGYSKESEVLFSEPIYL